MSLVLINKHLSIYFIVSLSKVFMLDTDNILIDFFLKINSIVRSSANSQHISYSPELIVKKKKSTMKVLISLVFVVLLENSNSWEYTWDAISNTDNYFDFPCGGDNSKILVIRMVDNRRKYCRGHLIHSRAALIPAQCLEGYGTNQSQLHISINSLGMYIEYRVISNTFIHPNYNSCYGINNFAIVTFDTPFQVDYDVICMPDQGEITAWSVNSCDTSNKNYFRNSYSEKEKCRDMILHHDYYKPENRNQLVHKMKKRKGMAEIPYSQWIICDFDHRGFSYSFIFASTFYATIDAGKKDEYYMVYRQDDVQEIIPWITDVITSSFFMK